MSEESTQTNISALERDEAPLRQHPLPWILFGFAAIVLAIVGGLLARRLSLETRRANEAIEKSVGLATQMESMKRQAAEVDSKVAAAEAKVKTAEDATFEATNKLRAMEAERDKLAKDLEAAKKVEAPKKVEPPPKKGKTKKKKKRR